DLRVWGRFANHADELGITLIMDELERHGHRGTFYVEPFGARHFGAAGLSAVCRSLRARGHDVQLHAHPMQSEPRFRSRGLSPPADDFADYRLDEQTRLIGEAIDALVAAGVPRDQIRSFRAGNFGANNDTWRAMAHHDLRVSSNLNLSYLKRNCRITWP